MSAPHCSSPPAHVIGAKAQPQCFGQHAEGRLHTRYDVPEAEAQAFAGAWQLGLLQTSPSNNRGRAVARRQGASGLPVEDGTPLYQQGNIALATVSPRAARAAFGSLIVSPPTSPFSLGSPGPPMSAQSSADHSSPTMLPPRQLQSGASQDHLTEDEVLSRHLNPALGSGCADVGVRCESLAYMAPPSPVMIPAQFGRPAQAGSTDAGRLSAGGAAGSISFKVPLLSMPQGLTSFAADLRCTPRLLSGLHRQATINSAIEHGQAAGTGHTAARDHTAESSFGDGSAWKTKTAQGKPHSCTTVSAAAAAAAAATGDLRQVQYAVMPDLEGITSCLLSSGSEGDGEDVRQSSKQGKGTLQQTAVATIGVHAHGLPPPSAFGAAPGACSATAYIADDAVTVGNLASQQALAKHEQSHAVDDSDRPSSIESTSACGCEFLQAGLSPIHTLPPAPTFARPATQASLVMPSRSRHSSSTVSLGMASRTTSESSVRLIASSQPGRNYMAEPHQNSTAQRSSGGSASSSYHRDLDVLAARRGTGLARAGGRETSSPTSLAGAYPMQAQGSRAFDQGRSQAAGPAYHGHMPGQQQQGAAGSVLSMAHSYNSQPTHRIPHTACTDLEVLELNMHNLLSTLHQAGGYGRGTLTSFHHCHGSGPVTAQAACQPAVDFDQGCSKDVPHLKSHITVRSQQHSHPPCSATGQGISTEHAPATNQQAGLPATSSHHNPSGVQKGPVSGGGARVDGGNASRSMLRKLRHTLQCLLSRRGTRPSNSSSLQQQVVPEWSTSNKAIATSNAADAPPNCTDMGSGVMTPAVPPASPGAEPCHILTSLPKPGLEQLPHLDLLDRIGRGSYGEVYKGVWEECLVAVKVQRWPPPQYTPSVIGGCSGMTAGAQHDPLPRLSASHSNLLVPAAVLRQPSNGGVAPLPVGVAQAWGAAAVAALAEAGIPACLPDLPAAAPPLSTTQAPWLATGHRRTLSHTRTHSDVDAKAGIVRTHWTTTSGGAPGARKAVCTQGKLKQRHGQPQVQSNLPPGAPTGCQRTGSAGSSSSSAGSSRSPTCEDHMHVHVALANTAGITQGALVEALPAASGTGADVRAGQCTGHAGQHLQAGAGAQALITAHEREASLGAQLHHPNVVATLSAFTVTINGERRTGTWLGAGAHTTRAYATYLVQELCDLGSLDAALRRGLLMQQQPGARATAHSALAGTSGLRSAPSNPLPFQGSEEPYKLMMMASLPHPLAFTGHPSTQVADMRAVLQVAKDIACGLHYLHGRHLAHGDLKSANCLLKSAARTPHDLRGFTVKIADFGSAHIIDNTVAAWTSPAVSKKGAVCTPLTEEPALATCDVACRGGAGDKDTGRPGVGVMPVCEASLSHAAPELVAGQLPSLAADTWSLGVILWELVTGEQPHSGLSRAQLLMSKLRLATAAAGAGPAHAAEAALSTARSYTHVTGGASGHAGMPALPGSTGPHALLLEHGLALRFPDWVDPGYVTLCYSCWHLYPACRPSTHEVMDGLKGVAARLLGPGATSVFPSAGYALQLATAQ